ncbi:MAG TPA: hypothetical protein VK627_00880 [Edaphobacter sp.]|jgi:hypothetical protein|nr:hypothetical protein [Edaphobacter sp.]
MLNALQDVILILLTVSFSLLLMIALNRFWPREKRKVHNDLIGWQLNILGTTYAVIIGFMLYTVWTDFGTASLNVDAEANAALNINRLAAGLPAVQGAELRQLSYAYATAVVEREWPMMARGEISTESNQLSRKMWQTLMSVKAASPAEITAEDHALYELSALTEHRQIRQLQATFHLPAILWCVLLIGGAVTLASACMFGQENTMLHGLQVFAFSLLVALVLVAVADIDKPFQGGVHVSDSAFQRARMNMQVP